MVKKLSRYGNSWALLIDKPILELLNISETTPLHIKTDGTCLIIEPIKSETETDNQVIKSEQLQKLYEELVKKYEPALKKLSEN